MKSKPGANDPTELVVSDLDDVFLPRPDDLLVSLVESRPALDKLLGSLSNLFKDTFTVGNALGAGLKAAYLLIVSRVFSSFLFPSSRCRR